ncbi:unnamed protein product (macronuclear) [Paramecium tetraurelia]|uniref:Alpha tubulin,putative n=1 Tax=Paramecium tetraurelia TaxID=5888 RepID=Q3SEG5_PARTE|nr:uncharacterized protein GSPATT00025063001 [Paramecium tetraurelia]CAI38959.1 alpha tubulin,putative [Paramecium tetraurelia]CAK92329.1 unnamed protein product [Paramecium tetraurelia]|eukprot:XP_001459726.1 hypothetical protein (macronuclear) [Paramecium tetraurelia strain d4-2]
MNQLITIHIGGAGSNIGSKLWYNLSQHRQEDLSSIFQENSHQSYKPRSIFVNTIDDQVPKYDEPQFSPNQFFYTKEDTGNIYTVGHYCVAKDLIPKIQDEIRRQVENCDHFSGFLFTHSISGGFGSGYTTLLSSLLKNEYQKSMSFSFCLMPSPNYRNNVIESYNSIMSLNSMVEAFDGVILLQNEAIYQIIENQLDIEFPSYNEVNQVITQPIISLLKFNQQQSLQMLKLNLWNKNKLNIWSCSFGPLINYDQKHFSKKITSNSLKDIISQNSYICNKSKPNYKQAFLYAEQINQTLLSKTLSELVENKQYSIYQQGQEGQIKQFKEPFQQINSQKENLVFIHKSTGIAEQLNQLHKNAQILYQKRAFMHWYVGIGIEDQSIRWEFSSFEEMQNNYAIDVSNNE